jgi:hypothetical protein
VEITTLSSREFNQDSSRAKKPANKGPDLSLTAAALLMCSSVSRRIANSLAPMKTSSINWQCMTPQTLNSILLSSAASSSALRVYA